MRTMCGYLKKYLSSMSVGDMAGLKFCLCAIGIIFGLCVPKIHKKPVLIGASAVFIATYLPLMAKLVKIIFEKDEEKA